MKPVVVAAVLERFGIAPPSRDLAGLCAVYAAWCRSVSFDNVLKMIHVAEERPGSLPGSTAEGFFEDWLACGAGGTCWAGNGALHGLLEALGFDAQRAIATMMPARSPAPNHGSVVVSLEGEQWITDASILTGAPIRIPAPGEPTGGGSLPRFEWLDGKPAVVWRTLSDARRLPVPHRADRRRPRRMGRLPPREWRLESLQLRAQCQGDARDRNDRRLTRVSGSRSRPTARSRPLRRITPLAGDSSLRSSAYPRTPRTASQTTVPYRPACQILPGECRARATRHDGACICRASGR